MSTTKNAQISRIFTIILAVIMFSAAFTVLSLQRDGYAYGTGETGQITASSRMYALVQAPIIRRSAA